MPEGHTLHRLALDHTKLFAGTPLEVTSPQGRVVLAAATVDGQHLLRATAYGKHLFYEWERGDIIHVHLGLFGRFFLHASPPPAPRETVRLRMRGEVSTIDLVGATACELMDPTQVDSLLARLGPDPIRRDGDPERAWPKLARRASPIGLALMDQSVIAGVGNVYRAEVLFVHGIHPEVPARTITHDQWMALWTTLQTWLRQGVKDRRIITVPPNVLGKPRSRITRGEALYVYKRDHCRICGTEIRRWDLGGRWAYACETCQPPPTGAGQGGRPRAR
ncbi:MAG: Fpg/Nei family DNA glycosylase [Acidimicrobiales bacterium]